MEQKNLQEIKQKLIEKISAKVLEKGCVLPNGDIELKIYSSNNKFLANLYDDGECGVIKISGYHIVPIESLLAWNIGNKKGVTAIARTTSSALYDMYIEDLDRLLKYISSLTIADLVECKEYDFAEELEYEEDCLDDEYRREMPWEKY